MAVRKIDLMHKLFGKADGKCKDCKHFMSNGYQKCLVYGDTRSEASDWVQRWQACGLFNQDTDHENVIRMVGGVKKEEQQIDGQMDMFTDYPGVPYQFDNMTRSMNL